ncbi:hypothetical protein pb186bvf_014919 [Paramecium bursaria]
MQNTKSTFFVTSRPKSSQTSQDQIDFFSTQYQKQVETEQEQYDQILELQYKFMDFRSEVRKERSSMEQTKSAIQMAEIVANSQIKSLQQIVKSQLESLEDKLLRETTYCEGFQNYMDQTIEKQKSEDQYSLSKRIKKLELDIGIEESNQ